MRTGWKWLALVLGVALAAILGFLGWVLHGILWGTYWWR